MLKVQNLKKHFGGVKAINGSSFNVEPGKITALIGPNGSGKTTVFNIISGIVEEDGGKVKLGKKDITHDGPDKVANKGVSRLFQKSALFENMSVKENLSLAIDNEDVKFWKNLFSEPKRSEERIKEILKMVEMNGFENKRAEDLSFGQKRLVEIGRSILKKHDMLMLDEPVAGVNPKVRDKIKEILLDMKKQGKTVFLVEHDMNFTFDVADKIIVMDHGKVIAEGTPKQIKNNKKVLDAYLGE
ncbi:MAG: ABC transporter ATP-binding protein [Candidatus Pacearchaeota archaeon]